MSLLTLEIMAKDAEAIERGYSECMGCGKRLDIARRWPTDPGPEHIVRWTCGTLRCNTLMDAKHIRGWRVIEGGRDA